MGERLISVAKKWKLLILCDDVYNLLNYSRTIEFSRLKALTPRGKVTSSLTAPSLRFSPLE